MAVCVFLLNRQSENRMASREKTFLAFGLPSDQSSRDQLKQFMQDVGFRDVLIEDGVAYLTVPEHQKLSDVQEKLSNSGRHKLIVMPEVAHTVTMVIDDEWRRTILQHRITLDEFRHRVDIDDTGGRIVLSGRSNEINKIVKHIESSVCGALSRQNSYRNERSDVDDRGRNSPAKELNGEEKKMNETQQQKNVKQRTENVVNGFTDHSDDSLADNNKISVNSKGTRPENGAKQRNNGSERKRNEMEEGDEQSEMNGIFRREGTQVDSASATITKAEREHKGRDEDSDLAVFPFMLEDHQWKFIRCFHPDVYAELNRTESGISCIRKENVSHLKHLKIDELETLNVRLSDTDTVHLKTLPLDIIQPKNILCEFNSREVTAVGLKEDLKQWWTKLSEELNNVKKSVEIDDCQLKFIEHFHAGVYKHINSLLQVQKTSNGKLLMSGKPDDINKLSNWITEHCIRCVECRQIQTRLSADEMKKAVGNTNRMLMIDKVRNGTWRATGSLQDIRSFQSEINDTETAIMKSSALLRTSATSKDSDLRFEFTTPRSSIDVIIAKGDLTKQDTEAIVSPSNSSLKPFGGAAKAIANAAGHQLVDECASFIRLRRFLSTTEAMYTSAGRMYPPIKYVIHACGPMDKGNWKLEEELEKTFVNCFRCAEECRVKSLSIPAISSGVFQVKKDIVAKCTWKALMRFDEEIRAKTLEKRVYLKEIRFINIDSEATESLVKTFRKCSNEYRFPQNAKMETASTESNQSQRKMRRSNSFSGLTSMLNGESKLDERSSLKTLAPEKSSAESPKINPVDVASGGVSVPKIKGASSAFSVGASSEATCCVCMKRKPVSLLETRSLCHHKCCSACSSKKCCRCKEITKLDSGCRSARSALHSTPPASSSEVDSRKSFVSSGSSLSRSRSASVSERGRDLLNEISDSDESRSSPVKTVQKKTQKEEDDDSDCCICMDTIKDAKRLDCGHLFCRRCIEKAFLHQPKCPSCGKIFGLLKGDQPDGTMTASKDNRLELSGYRGCGAIVIKYDIPDGVQSSAHPNPGKRYRGTRRLAYLPGNAEGEEICRLLRKAFDAKLIFTVGKSNTTGRENVVVWNDIHHKTDISGQYGYPDSTYLKRVREELAAKGIRSSSSSPPAVTSDNSKDSPVSEVSLKTGTGDRYFASQTSSGDYYSLPIGLNSAGSSHSRETASGGYAGLGHYGSQAVSSISHRSTGSSGAGSYNRWTSDRLPYYEGHGYQSNFHSLGPSK